MVTKGRLCRDFYSVHPVRSLSGPHKPGAQCGHLVHLWRGHLVCLSAWFLMSRAQETLEQCCVKLQELSGSIDRIRSLRLNSDSSVLRDLVVPPPTPTSPAMPGNQRAAARCHECHGPIAGYHQGYPHGLGLCQLEHYDLCPGAVLEKDRGGHIWKTCPEEYEPPEGSQQSSNEQDPDFSPPAETVSPGSGVEDEANGAPGVQARDQLSDVHNGPTSLPPFVLPKNGEGKTDADILIEAELAELAVAEKEEEKLQELARLRKKKEESLQNIARLSRQAQGEGARSKTSFHNNIDMLRANNQSSGDSRRDNSIYRGPIISEIREDSYTRDNVEGFMQSHVYDIPAFSQATQHKRGQPRLKQPVVNLTVPDNGQGGEHSPAQGEVLYKWVMRTDQYGREYKELVEVAPGILLAKPREVVTPAPGWYYDDQSGRMYRSQVQAPAAAVTGDQVRVERGPHHVYVDSRAGGHSPGRGVQRADVRHTPAVVRQATVQSERVPGIVPLTVNQTEEREGKIPVSIASHARNLPMEYARSATSKNMNMAVFMYGAIHELHSSRIGITPAMQRGVLEAKLQHLLNVIHVTCLNASATEFKPVAWSVGRTYHNLIQAKVDSGREDWTDFDMLHRGSPHAAEMVAAEREHRAALMAKPDGVKKNDKKDDSKAPCTSWNGFEEEGKCKYEADHPGEKCNRAHFCSYCKKKYPNNRTIHQSRFCKKKLEDDK